MNGNKEKAIILLSGGLDSATVLAIAKSRGFECYAISFRYGQRHALELECAAQIAQTLEVVEHRTIDIGLGAFGGSALTDMKLDVPHEKSNAKEIPITYVPARNTIFLSYALAWAEILKSTNLFIGVNALDYSGYPDCRPEFIKAYETLANLATKIGVIDNKKLTIHAPLIHWTKARIIQEGLKLGVDYGITSSCYDPSSTGEACGMCDSCRLRLKGFKEAHFTDPRHYVVRY